MAKNQIRNFQKYLSPAALLSNPIASKTMSDSKYLQQVANFFVNEPEHIFEVTYTRLENNLRFKNLLASYSTQIEKFSKDVLVIGGLKPKRLWLIYKTALKSNSEKISQFVHFRDRIERLILLGSYKEADGLLIEVFHLFGESLWYVRIKILILSMQERTEELRTFCEDCKSRAGPSILSYLFHCSQLITDSNDASIILNSLVFGTANEFKGGRYKEIASLIETLFAPYPLQGKYKYVESLDRAQQFPIVDQYVIVTGLIKMAVAEQIATGVSMVEEIEDILNVLSHCIKDPQLQQVHITHLGGAESGPSAAGKILLEHYELGNYSSVISNFERLKDEIENPLAYVNLVAKATAHLALPSEISNHGNLLQSLISQLATIYKLDPFWPQAEEAIISTAIKYHCFSFGPHIQLTLYKALPNKYISHFPELAASMSLSATAEITPLTRAMINSNHDALEVDAETENDAVPIYRNLKRQIFRAINESISQEEIESKLEKLKVLTPLRIDYIEVLSTYCLHTNQAERLISTAAEMLAQNMNEYVCFPLEKLITFIEERRLSNLSAVIVAYIYNRYVSQNRDYVLHEAFEEYLQDQQVNKPSELLGTMKNLKNVEIVFFREICLPEVMDFLSCFENTNELRAERVRLLDQLLELNIIDTDSRMREVEEIVSQVIIDAGTSDFNGPKIFVDDQSIRKKYSDEMKALLAIYKLAKDSSEDRITMLGEHYKSNGLLQAYVSGDKNSAVLKMASVLGEAFHYDEKYGLDKNLSAEIRHGFFSNLMRARLEERKLITESDDFGKYQKNVYWRERNSLLRDEFWVEIELHLGAFSANFNQLIIDAEEWMKIVDDELDQKDRVFTYLLGKHEFDRIKSFVDVAIDAEKVSAFIMDIMWEKTESYLDIIRDKINGEFRDKVDALFDRLETNIRASKGTIQLIELMSAIGHARSEIKEDITTVAEWFRRIENLQLQAQSLDRVIEIAISSFEQVKGGASAIQRNISHELRSVEVPGRSVKPFIIAVTNLLDNCYRRSGLGHSTRVEVNGAPAEGGANVIIKNNLSDEKAELLTEKFLLSIESTIQTPEARTLMRTEGGSGLIKAYNEIVTFGPNSTLRVSRDDEYFSAVICYDC